MSTNNTEAPHWFAPAGTVVGFRDDGVARATGIRYARANRYQEPTPEPAATSPIDATSWAPACPQGPDEVVERVIPAPLGQLAMDEHCQRLSLTLPVDVRPEEALPVMVWIHGGAYLASAGDAPLYDPAVLVREQRVIVVAVTYRLGLLGFLGRPAISPANLGLLDQLEALRWVQRNIAAFGGDAANVTIFGESAGADAVAHLMIARGSEGLFRRAIIQSAPLGLTRGRAVMSGVLAREAASLPSDASTDELVATQARLTAVAKRFGLKAFMPFGVQYGLHPMPPEDELDDAWQRVASRIDVLIGCTTRETALHAVSGPFGGKVLPLPLIGWLAELLLVRLASWKIYVADVSKFAQRHRRGGGRGYRYLFSWGVPGNPFGAAHIVELPLLFPKRSAWEPTKILAGARWPEIEAQGRPMREIWAEFARSGAAPVGERPGLITIWQI